MQLHGALPQEVHTGLWVMSNGHMDGLRFVGRREHACLCVTIAIVCMLW